MTGRRGFGGAHAAVRRAHAAVRALAALAILAGGLLVACGGGVPGGRTSAPLPTPRPSASAAMQATLVQLDGALRASGLVLESTLAAIRPAEPPSFAGVARWPLHVVLPDDPAGGYFVVYEFPDRALAADGGRDLAAYVASGPGRVQYPADARFVLRQVASTLVFYPWSPSSAPDPKTPEVAAALASVGSEVPIPRG